MVLFTISEGQSPLRELETSWTSKLVDFLHSTNRPQSVFLDPVQACHTESYSVQEDVLVHLPVFLLDADISKNVSCWADSVRIMFNIDTSM